MDRREAIDILVGVIATNSEEENEALDLAIEALKKVSVYEQVKWERDMALQTLEEHGIGLGQKAESATTTDCISRQQAIEAMCRECCLVFSDDEVDCPDCTEVAVLKNLPPVTPTERTGWIPVSEPPKDGRNVFLAHGTNNFKSCCIGHYDHSMKIWYEDKNFFANPIYDCKYWCDIPELPDMGDSQFEPYKDGDTE